MNQPLRRFVIALLLAVVVYGGVVVYTGYQKIGSALHVFRWEAFLFALGLSSLNYLLRFAKWEYYLARLGIRGVKKGESLLIFLSGFVLTITPRKSRRSIQERRTEGNSRRRHRSHSAYHRR